MLILMIVCVVISFVCLNMTVTMTKNGIRTEKDMDVSRTMISLGIGAGAALYLIGAFNLGYSGDADVWDYGKLTTEGFLNITAQIVGVIGIAENVVAAAFLLMKEANRASGPKHTEVSGGEKKRVQTEPVPEVQIKASPMPQDKVPAWKQVEMENQNK